MRAAAVFLLLMVGCLDAGPPEDSAAWTDVKADLWFTHTVGCQMCGLFGGTEPKASVLAVYRDGSLLWYSFAMGPDNITFAPGLEPWHVEVLAVHERQRDNWSRDMHHVVEAHTGHGASWSETEARLLEIHARLEDPGPDDRSGCADCGGPYVQAFDPDIHAALFENFEEGDPWDRLLDELRALRQQVEPQPS